MSYQIINILFNCISGYVFLFYLFVCLSSIYFVWFGSARKFKSWLPIACQLLCIVVPRNSNSLYHMNLWITFLLIFLLNIVLYNYTWCWISNSQEECLQRLQRRIDVPYDSSIIEHQVPLILLLFKSMSNCGNHYDVHFNLCTQLYLLSVGLLLYVKPSMS